MNIHTILHTLGKPSPLTLATAELEQAQRDLLSAAAHREHYAAIERMLKERITRLRIAINDLSSETPNA